MAVLVYPMNALAIDQMDRLRGCSGVGHHLRDVGGHHPRQGLGADVERAPEPCRDQPLAEWL